MIKKFSLTLELAAPNSFSGVVWRGDDTVEVDAEACFFWRRFHVGGVICWVVVGSVVVLLGGAVVVVH